ncbi:hypothetical protein [Streptosporangium sp. CA-115845]|uniref:hypothetical protein n=1 Tax=Streptosporangium sp. CA-115845 TaxID=3240071 RepID=UPI003D8EDDEA
MLIEMTRTVNTQKSVLPVTRGNDLPRCRNFETLLSLVKITVVNVHRRARTRKSLNVTYLTQNTETPLFGGPDHLDNHRAVVGMGLGQALQRIRASQANEGLGVAELLGGTTSSTPVTF